MGSPGGAGPLAVHCSTEESSLFSLSQDPTGTRGHQHWTLVTWNANLQKMHWTCAQELSGEGTKTALAALPEDHEFSWFGISCWINPMGTSRWTLCLDSHRINHGMEVWCKPHYAILQFSRRHPKTRKHETNFDVSLTSTCLKYYHLNMRLT